MLGISISSRCSQAGQDLALEYAKEILPHVSRTFDLAIRFLPVGLRSQVGVAYLLCRVADTLEDSPLLSPVQRQATLKRYAELVGSFDGYDDDLVTELRQSFDGDLVRDLSSKVADQHAYYDLVRNLDRVLLAVDALPPQFKRHVFPRVKEMSLGMADYVIKTGSDSGMVAFLEDEADWNRYCYYVAGTVGHMLTDIFSDHVGFSDATRQRLHQLGQSFGLGLQKVNVLKDAVVDTARGVCFLPKTLVQRHAIAIDQASRRGFKGDLAGLVHHVAEISRQHFVDAVEYIRMIPVRYRGLRMFLIVPVMLAAATLRLFVRSPQRLLEKGDVKLRRSEVWSLVRRSAFCKYSNRILLSSFNQIYPT